MLKSFYTALGPALLPAMDGRQVYMQPIDIENPSLPDAIADYLAPVVDLIRKAGVTMGTAFLTVDEKVVEAGMSQRRPGPHVDGCFVPEGMYWGHGGGGWNHYCNNVPMDRMP